MGTTKGTTNESAHANVSQRERILRASRFEKDVFARNETCTFEEGTPRRTTGEIEDAKGNKSEYSLRKLVLPLATWIRSAGSKRIAQPAATGILRCKGHPKTMWEYIYWGERTHSSRSFSVLRRLKLLVVLFTHAPYRVDATSESSAESSSVTSRRPLVAFSRSRCPFLASPESQDLEELH